jgi:hypothetical protein
MGYKKALLSMRVFIASPFNKSSPGAGCPYPYPEDASERLPVHCQTLPYSYHHPDCLLKYFAAHAA